MNSSFYDTSSSIYPDEFNLNNKENFYKNLYRTPSPIGSLIESSSSSSENEFCDDVYKPYITPPSPFEHSTQKISNRVKPTNPYAQSLWCSFGGNEGGGIENYKKITTDTKLMPSLMQKKIYANSNKENIKFNTKLNGDSIKTNWSSWSYNAKKNKIKYEDPDDKILKPLNDPPPYEFISIESLIIKNLKILLNLSIKFDTYIKSNHIIINSNIKLSLFSNIKTLLLIHNKFLDTILNRDNRNDLEEIIYDYLQRLYHVYPSYLNSLKSRKYFAASFNKVSKFKSFLIENSSEIGNNEFYNLITSPSEDFKNLLEYLNDYIGESSPRIRVLISKFLTCYEDSLYVNQSICDKILYLEIPQQWKLNNKMNWKEISNMNIEKQMVYYLKWELKSQYQKYCKVMKYIRYQIEQVSKIAISNISIFKNFVKIQNDLPNSEYIENNKYDKHLKQVENENKQLYNLIQEFNNFINNETLKNIDSIIVNSIGSIKRIINCGDVDNKYFIDQLFKIHQLKIFFEESMYLVFNRYLNFIGSYFDLMENNIRLYIGDEIFSNDQIIQEFQDKKIKQQQRAKLEEAHFAVYNDELERVCAKGRLVRRFFTS